MATTFQPQSSPPNARASRRGRGVGTQQVRTHLSADCDLAAQLAAMWQLHKVVSKLNAARDLEATLHAVAEGVVSSLGYEIAAVTVVRADNDIEVAAVAGLPDAASPVGQVSDRATWDALLAIDAWGPLRFVKYQIWPDNILGGDPGVPACADDTAWQPMDGLLVPLRTPEGELVGVLSVDKPCGGASPRPWQDELLDAFAAQAAIAIDNARLHTRTAQAIERLETERRALRASEDRFRQMFDGAPTGMALIGLHGDHRGRFVRVNAALCHLLGHDMADLRGRAFTDLVEENGERLLAGIDDECVELRLRRGDGSLVWVSARASVVACPHGGPEVKLAHIWDVDDRMRREEHLTRLATQDPLTGLPNRGGLIQRLRPALTSDQPVAVLYCDLDGFKGINDRYGHRAGDVVLTEVARRLSVNVRGDDVVARLGGDEFVVLACGLTEAGAHQLAAQLSTCLSVPVLLGGGRVVCPSASFGIGWTAAGTRISMDELMELADCRMYRHKRARRESDRSARVTQ